MVMDVAHDDYLRECELDAALAQSQADVVADKHQNLYSVSVNLSYRITPELLVQDQQITPINVETRSFWPLT